MHYRVGLAQINPILGDPEQNLKKHQTMISQAKSRGVELLIFPELSLTGYFLKDMVPVVAHQLDGPLVHSFAEQSRELALLVGMVEEAPDHFYYNAALYFEGGSLIHVHRKIYLPTYGIFDELRYLARGKKLRAFDTRFGRCGTLICEDFWHPSTGYILAQDGADVIFAPACSPGRGVSEQSRLRITETVELITRFYAKTFGVYVFYAHRVGYEDGINFWGGSHIVSPEGEVLVCANNFEEELVVCDVDPREVRRTRIFSPMSRDEDLDLTVRELLRIQREKYA